MNRKNEIDNRIIDFNDIMEDDIDTGIEDIENKYAALDIDAEDKVENQSDNQVQMATVTIAEEQVEEDFDELKEFQQETQEEAGAAGL